MKENTNAPIYTLTGTVIHGRGIGKHVGTPTANMEIRLLLFHTQQELRCPHINAHCSSNPKASYSLVIESYELLLQTLFNPLAAFILFIIFELKSGRPVACNHTRKTVHMVLLSRHTPLHIILAIDEINQP